MVWALLLPLLTAPGEVRWESPLTALAPRWQEEGDWSSLGGHWTAQADGLEGGPAASQLLLQAVPALLRGNAAVTVQPRRRERADGWVTTTLLLWESPRRYWQFGLVEDPDRETRRMELLEAYDAAWQAQTSGLTRLAGGARGDGGWQWDQPWRLELAWEPTRISARGRPLAAATWAWEASFDLRGETPAVRVGQVGLKADGLRATFRDAAVSGVTAPTERVSGRQAVLCDGAGPWQTTGWKAAAASFTKLLTAAGYQLRSVTPEELAVSLNREQDGLLAVPSLATLPRETALAVSAWCTRGGDLLASGDEPFKTVLFRDSRGRWVSRQDALRTVTASRVVFDPVRTRGLTRAASPWEPAPVISPGATGADGQPSALRVAIPQVGGWDVLTTPPFESSPFGTDCTLTVVTAKGTSGQSITVEWKETDGSRWIAQLKLTDGWSTTVLEPQDFAFWSDGSPPERAGTRFRPAGARILSFGPAVGHGALAGQPCEYWLAPLGVAASPLGETDFSVPDLETLAPWYKQFATRRGSELVRQPIARQRGLSATPELDGRYSVVGDLLTPVATRWADASGALYYWLPSAAPAAATQPAVVDLLRGGQSQVVLYNSGPAGVTARPQQPLLVSARVANQGGTPAAASLRWRLLRGTTEVQREERALTLQPGAPRGVSWDLPAGLPVGEYTVETSVATGGQPVDSLRAELRVLPPPPAQPTRRVEVVNGRFVAAGRRLFLHGVNYWPRYVAGSDVTRYNSHWLMPQNYDPVLVEADLASIAKLGMNLVSIQYTDPVMGPSLRDFLDRCRRLGLWVNVYLAGTHPLSPDLAAARALLAAADLPADSAVFAYDLAWEPKVGRATERRRLDPAWRDWLTEQYGSPAAAEAQWGVAAPREETAVSGPTDAQFQTDGPHRPLTAAYRRFLDDLVSRGYGRVVRGLRALDPHTLLGARTGWGGTAQQANNANGGYDLLSGAAWLDFTSPEGYGLPDNFAAGRAVGFVTAYGRWAGAGKPIFWSEYGHSIGPRGGTSASQRQQAAIWETMLQVINDSDGDAAAGWWWPGGWRLNELSDYGVLAPEGTPREAAVVAAKVGQQIAARGTAAGQGVPQRLVIDRDADARGMHGLLLRHGAEYARLRATGRPVEVVTAGSGCTTANLPRTAVGGQPQAGVGPLQYANAEIGAVTVRWDGGQASGDNGLRVALPDGVAGRIEVELVNTGEATWLAAGPGAVTLTGGLDELRLPADLPRYGRVTLSAALPTPRPATLTARLQIAGLGPLGEPLRIDLATR
ncbi:MAG: hypothetical protein IT204_15765 [Fimbriimonadaceae bacterium]|nr:hypothetical protein [Fimbriimonadaceae bacterium]